MKIEGANRNFILEVELTVLTCSSEMRGKVFQWQ